MLLDAVPDLDMTGRERMPVGGEVPNPITPPPGCAFHPRCPLANDAVHVASAPTSSPPARPWWPAMRWRKAATMPCRCRQSPLPSAEPQRGAGGTVIGTTAKALKGEPSISLVDQAR